METVWLGHLLSHLPLHLSSLLSFVLDSLTWVAYGLSKCLIYSGCLSISNVKLDKRKRKPFPASPHAWCQSRGNCLNSAPLMSWGTLLSWRASAPGLMGDTGMNLLSPRGREWTRDLCIIGTYLPHGCGLLTKEPGRSLYQPGWQPYAPVVPREIMLWLIMVFLGTLTQP